MSALKKLRELQNHTQEELAQRSGVSVRTIQRIESGQEPKGYTLRVLAETLGVDQKQLQNSATQAEAPAPSATATAASTTPPEIDFRKLKLLNLSSLPFVIVPLFNILVPLLLMYRFKLKGPVARQIISLQIMWSILAPIVFMPGIFLKPGNQITMLLMMAIVLSNVYLILRNTRALDKNKMLHHTLNFSFL